MSKWFKRDKTSKTDGAQPSEDSFIINEEKPRPDEEDGELDFIFETAEEVEAEAVETQEASAPAESAVPAEPPAEPAEEVRPAAAPEPEPRKKGFLVRLKERLAGTRAVLTTRVDHLLLGVKQIDEDVLEELEEILITSDLGVKTTQALLKTISEKVARRELNSGERLKQVLREEMAGILSLPPADIPAGVKPHVMMVVGVNGVGKTTTIAKLAHRFISEGRKVMIVAGDTFRAAAVEQLQIWADRVGAEIVKQKTGADPSAVVFDGLHAAVARNIDLVIIDTAGRLHTKVNLMEELKKMKRIAARELPGAPHEVLLVLDATTGQNAVNQARLFHEAVQVDHIAMTKLDGTAKGGILVAICHELGLPIRYIGLGESMDDLRDFDPEAFVDALFG